jgi:lysozyme family protein
MATNRRSRNPRYRGGKARLALSLSTIIIAVFAVEGGYVNDPVDPGGATNHGITERVAREHGFTGNMRDLPKTCEVEGQVCAESIYREDYIDKPGFTPLVYIDPAVGEEVIDTAVNMGPARPSRYFQRALNDVCGTFVAVDGKIGPSTVGSWLICRLDKGPAVCVAMLDALDRQQEAEYDRLVRVNPALQRFRRGWQNHRINNVDRAECAAQELPE